MEQWAGSKLRKKYVKPVYCHPAYLTYKQNAYALHAKCWAGWLTGWNQVCWESYQQPQICRWYHPYVRKQRKTKEPLDDAKDESKKSGLKLNIKKTNTIQSNPITSWQIDGDTMERVTDFVWALKSLQMVTAVI